MLRKVHMRSEDGRIRSDCGLAKKAVASCVLLGPRRATQPGRQQAAPAQPAPSRSSASPAEELRLGGPRRHPRGTREGRTPPGARIGMADRLSDRKHSGQNQSGVMTRSADGFSTNGGSQKQQWSEPSLPGSIPLVPQPVDCPKQQRGSASPKVVPLPDGVDRTTPGIGKAWAWFLECDADGSGLLEFPELCILTKRIGLNWGKSRIRKAYEDMNVSTPFASREGVTFQDFATWWGRYEAQRRRDVGRIVKELFTHAGAFLYKNEDSSIGNEDSSMIFQSKMKILRSRMVISTQTRTAAVSCHFRISKGLSRRRTTTRRSNGM